MRYFRYCILLGRCGDKWFPMGRININERTLLTRYFVFLFLFIYIMNTAFAVFKCKGKDNCCLSIDQTLVLILKFCHFSPSSETFILSYLKYPLLFLIQHFASWKFTSLLEKIKKRKEKKRKAKITQPRKQKVARDPGSPSSFTSNVLVRVYTARSREEKEPRKYARERREGGAFIRGFIIKGLLKIVLQPRSPVAIHGKKERKEGRKGATPSRGGTRSLSRPSAPIRPLIATTSPLVNISFSITRPSTLANRGRVEWNGERLFPSLMILLCTSFPLFRLYRHPCGDPHHARCPPSFYSTRCVGNCLEDGDSSFHHPISVRVLGTGARVVGVCCFEIYTVYRLEGCVRSGLQLGRVVSRGV